MRTTQYVGLTKAAKTFVSSLKELPSDSNTSGMFSENIPLKKWEIHPMFAASVQREDACIREKLQDSPWSSGPMLFTCLEIDYGNGAQSTAFEWVHDPTVSNEYNQESGALWV